MVTDTPAGGIHCPICRARDWNLNPQLVAKLPINEKGTYTKVGQTSLLVSMTCKQCACELSMNARSAKII